MRHDETGASAVEYGILVAGVAALVVTIVFALGGNLDAWFTQSCEGIRDGAAQTGTC